MKTGTIQRILAMILAMILVVSVVPATAASVTYTLDAAELETFESNAKADGDSTKAGTDEFFTIFWAAKNKVQANEKSFPDGFAGTKRIHYGASTKIGETVSSAVMFKAPGAATVKVWWVCGDPGREIGIYNDSGAVITQTSEALAKNAVAVSTLQIPTGGTYYIGNVGGSNYHYKIEVTTTSAGSSGSGGEWGAVADPVISSAVDNGEGGIKVTVDAIVGDKGGDEVRITMMDAQGNEILTRRSVLEKTQHSLTFNPESSGKYIFKAVLAKKGQPDKAAAQTVTVDFVYPLASPNLISATSEGGGKVSLVWSSVKEATSYAVYCNDTLAGTADGTEYTVSGLNVGETYKFHVVAIRGSDRAKSNEISAEASAEAKQVWGFTYYGPSTNAEKNGYIGSLNEDGFVTVYSEGGKGKIVPASVDGLAFYYTAVPAEYNFTLKARITVDSWTYSNGQDGFGLLVTDRLGPIGDSSNFWNNQYMAVATKVEYRYDVEGDVAYALNDPSAAQFPKYSMKLGLGVIEKIGVTPENLDQFIANDTDTINKHFSSITLALERSAGYWEMPSGTYNIIGNCTNKAEESVDKGMLTEMILQIQKNNTGYFITYFDTDGKTVLAQRKFYGADNLCQLDPDYVYAGFFAARNARVTFSDVEFSTILASEDAPAEERPITKIEPSLSIASGAFTTSGEYTLLLDTNVSGTVQITVDGKVIAEADSITGLVRFAKVLSLAKYGSIRIQLRFTPDPNQDLGPNTALSSTNAVFESLTLTYSKGNYHSKSVYVSPTGLPNNNGTKEYPYDIYTAVNNVVPGQTIILMEGTYKMLSSLKIQRGMDGTAEEMIRMIADPDASTRPVIDFQKLHTGIVHGGDYWYFYGFDVTNSADGQKGFQVSGDYNVLDNIHTYYNGNTGIQISRYSGSDLFPDWPSYNLILNCTSYCNADPGYEDADGFAAKLTCGEGNVFDGCVAYNNADDGWDLYAKVETGPIGAVTIRNCVAYANGYLPGSTKTGNGNGFKMGGDSLSGKHVLENSYAFFNLSKGIDSNSCPDIIVRDCISYNNGRYNVALYTNNAANTNFFASGILSFKDSSISQHTMLPADALSTGEQLKGKGSQDTSQYSGDSNYYWNGTSSVNGKGAAIDAGIFVSLEFQGIARHADGTIDMQGFLELTDKAPQGSGVRPGGTASDVPVLQPEDEAHNYSQQWFIEDALYHWKECECGAKAELADHVLEWIIDKEATPEAPGLKHQECTVCGHKKPAIETYYEAPVVPTEPSEPAQTEPSVPAPTQPKPTEPADPQPSSNGGMIWILVGVVVAAAAVVIVILLKKKKS